MRYHALAVDFDGTLAHDGKVEAVAIDALRALRKSGRRPILATGRILDDLAKVFPELDVFDAIVAENGAVLYDPATRKFQTLAPPPPEKFIEALERRGVRPIDRGHTIVATWQPHEAAVLDAIRALGLDLSVTFNKGAVMVLPSGVNKASGLARQLDAFKLSFHNVAGVGDAENDLRFLEKCEASAAVANALTSVKEQCDIVLDGDHGHGVCELIERIIDDDLASEPAIARHHHIPLGKTEEGTFDVPASPPGILLAGTSGGGKSTMVAGLIERIAEAGYQYFIVDPEGDFMEIDGAIAIGDVNTEPNLNTINDVLLQYDNGVISLLAIKIDDRSTYARRLMGRISELRAHYGRPHWLIVDETHHLFPSVAGQTAKMFEPQGGVVYTTTDPRLVAREALECVDIVVAFGKKPLDTIQAARKQLGVPEPKLRGSNEDLPKGEALVWQRARPDTVTHIQTIPGKAERHRHARKYAQGELAEEKSFYFTGPAGKLHLRAQNLLTFVQIADGVDDETWLHHLRRHDYSDWMDRCIGDDELSSDVRAVEDNKKLSPGESRKLIDEAVRKRYTTG